jgi:hypothetical protein
MFMVVSVSWAGQNALYLARINAIIAPNRCSRFGGKYYYKRVCRYRDIEVETTSLLQ